MSLLSFIEQQDTGSPPLYTTRNVCSPAISRFAAHDDNKRFFHFPPANNFQCFSNSLVVIFLKQFSFSSITLLKEIKYREKVTCAHNLFMYIDNSFFCEIGLRSNFRSTYSNSSWLKPNYVLQTVS